MHTTTELLQRLRGWFIVYYLFNLVVGTWASVAVVDMLKSSSMPFVDALEYVPDGAIIGWSLFVGTAVFALGLFLFHRLLQRAPWARIVMLVIAWLTGVSALISLLSTCGTFSASGWLAQAMPEADWGTIGLLSGLTNLASLAFSAYTIRTLQFDPKIREEFEPRGPATGQR